MKKKLRKITSVCLAVIMMLGTLTIAPISVSAATYGDFSYTLNSDFTCEITKYNGKALNVTIPSTIYGNKVTKIGDYAFRQTDVVSVTIPNGVTELDYGCFEYCENLKNVYIPNSVETIGGAAFWECTNLTSFAVPSGVKTIGDTAFYKCTNLKTLSISETVSDMDTDFLFGNDYGLTCKMLESITVDSRNKNFSSYEGVLFNKNKTKILFYPINKQSNSYVIPNTVTTISIKQFYNRLNLKTITVPESVTSISSSSMGYYQKGYNEYKIDGFTIKGYKGTAAERYARNNDFTFVELQNQASPTSVKLNNTSLTLGVGETYTLTKTVTPSNASTSYTWSSSNTSVATVDSNGKVTAKKAGTANITVKTSNGKTATCKVTVTATLATPSITNLQNTADGIRISWNKVSGAYGYRLYYKYPGKDWKRFKDTTSTSFTDTGVSAGRTETYTIRCIDKDGNTISGYNSGGWSYKYEPVNPTITKLENTSDGIKISWNKIAGVYGYRLYYKYPGKDWKRFKDTTSTSFTDTGVSLGRTETYTIRCIDKNGNTISGYNPSGWSKTYSLPSSIPQITKLENTSSGIKISWNKVAGVYGYRLYYKYPGKDWKRFKDTTATSFIDTGVSAGRTETYTIRCIDKNGNTISGYYSNGWSKKYEPVTPTITKLEKTSNGVKISWNPVAGVYGYRLYYKYPGQDWKRFKDTIGTSFTDTGVKYGRTETYTIRCIDKNGNTISGYNPNGWSITY